MTLTSYVEVGANIFDEEWDLAIILDGCRVDALEQVADEYAFLTDIQTATSLGSSSKEWMVNTFQETHRSEIAETIYITGNGWENDVLREDVPFSNWTVTKGTWANDNRLVDRLLYRPTATEADFEHLIHQQLTDINGVDAFCPKELTDLTIKAGRENDAERVLAHYMQPHQPYIHRAAAGNPATEIDSDPFGHLGEGNDDAVWEAYLDNLRHALDQVAVLLANFDGDVLITADHGEMFGRPPFAGHGEGIPHPALKRVPWVKTTASDQSTRQPDVEMSTEQIDNTAERLSALGYL
ncbi:hypothetical protein [Halorhabdus sp. BNX81]|uniref:hypothetical protein n=1 Tax=Halorhabdus sp. BNX81 TaxID=2980181 RepID=UPI0023DD4695|nr:hypothetical protein [Halorhabdus sp. BNX81]WEL20594.1 Arylsulfatase A [Halorhabdus sp. BNX81]